MTPSKATARVIETSETPILPPLDVTGDNSIPALPPFREERRERVRSFIFLTLLSVLYAASASSLSARNPWYVILLSVFILLTIQVISGRARRVLTVRLKLLGHGTFALLIFTGSLVLGSTNYLILGIMQRGIWSEVWQSWLLNVGLFALAEALLFWNGIIFVYTTSVQLGISLRVFGVLFGLIPPVNMVILGIILKRCIGELRYENRRERCNRRRQWTRPCQTRYPVLLVHGVFFRDSARFNYWGRIPKDLQRMGCEIYYGEHQSAASVRDSAEELSRRIKAVLALSGAQKVNVIAHSKGGLDIRYAITHFGMGQYIASLTTVNTPHKGCSFAEYLLSVCPTWIRNKIAGTYNKVAWHAGDHEPDFLAAVTDLTATACNVWEETLPMPEGIFCQSVASFMEKGIGGGFPMALTHGFVKRFDGPNDGLVAGTAQPWGERCFVWESRGFRGVSHGDVIDLLRENIPGFDVREHYVQLVADLKNRGL